MPKGLYVYISSSFNFLSSISGKAMIQTVGNKCNKQEKNYHFMGLWICNRDFKMRFSGGYGVFRQWYRLSQKDRISKIIATFI